MAAALEIAPVFRLTASGPDEILGDVRAAVGRWRDVARRVGLSEQDCTSMAWAFEAAGAAGRRCSKPVDQRVGDR